MLSVAIATPSAICLIAIVRPVKREAFRELAAITWHVNGTPPSLLRVVRITLCGNEEGQSVMQS